jgi:hypothetical protein
VGDPNAKMAGRATDASDGISREALRAGISRSVWHVATSLIFEELSSGRGVVVPELGTFTIDVREKFRGTAGMEFDRRPAFVLSAAFESLGVRLPASRPGGRVAAHMIRWQSLASRCGIDRDLARRAVASTVSAFVSTVAGMAATSARSSGVLDLGPCGKLRILRCADRMRSGCEPRVSFSAELLAAVHNAAATEAAVRSTPSATSLAAPTAACVPPPALPDVTDPSLDALDSAEELAMAQMMVTRTAKEREVSHSVEPGVCTLEALRHPRSPVTAGWAECVSTTAPQVAAASCAAKATATSAEGKTPREPLQILPIVEGDVDEWRARKLQTGRELAAPRVYSSAERRRRIELDITNLRTAKARSTAAKETEARKAAKEARGVDRLLDRLLERPHVPAANAAAAAAAAAVMAAARERLDAAQTSGPMGTAGVRAEEGLQSTAPAASSDGEEAEATLLLRRKMELQVHGHSLRSMPPLGSIDAPGCLLQRFLDTPI